MWRQKWKVTARKRSAGNPLNARFTGFRQNFRGRFWHEKRPQIEKITPVYYPNFLSLWSESGVIFPIWGCFHAEKGYWNLAFFFSNIQEFYINVLKIPTKKKIRAEKNANLIGWLFKLTDTQNLEIFIIK